jgi:hypothetical protein
MTNTEFETFLNAVKPKPNQGAGWFRAIGRGVRTAGGKVWKHKNKLIKAGIKIHAAHQRGIPLIAAIGGVLSSEAANLTGISKEDISTIVGGFRQNGGTRGEATKVANVIEQKIKTAPAIQSAKQTPRQAPRPANQSAKQTPRQAPGPANQSANQTQHQAPRPANQSANQTQRQAPGPAPPKNMNIRTLEKLRLNFTQEQKIKFNKAMELFIRQEGVYDDPNPKDVESYRRAIIQKISNGTFDSEIDIDKATAEYNKAIKKGDDMTLAAIKMWLEGIRLRMILGPFAKFLPKVPGLIGQHLDSIKRARALRAGFAAEWTKAIAHAQAGKQWQTAQAVVELVSKRKTQARAAFNTMVASTSPEIKKEIVEAPGLIHQFIQEGLRRHRQATGALASVLPGGALVPF